MNLICINTIDIASWCCGFCANISGYASHNIDNIYKTNIQVKMHLMAVIQT